ncbi:MAG: hypothetical protein FOGNACKC_00846 [Anaerolineae bacterium]|nr:hypothetical protein [Anaerolineae bacterium]
MNAPQLVENGLYRHLLLINMGGKVLVDVDYYVLRGGEVFAVSPLSKMMVKSNEKPDNLRVMDYLGEYDPNWVKAKNYNLPVKDVIKALDRLSGDDPKGAEAERLVDHWKREWADILHVLGPDNIVSQGYAKDFIVQWILDKARWALDELEKKDGR